MVFVMTLVKDDLPELKTFFYEWLAEAEAGLRPSAFELSLQERLIRVEEALSNQIELTRQGFAAMEKRFDSIDKRFEAADKRFDAITLRMDRFMLWSFSTTIAGSSLVIAVLKLWSPV